jgi:hypothetical protein
MKEAGTLSVYKLNFNLYKNVLLFLLSGIRVISQTVSYGWTYFSLDFKAAVFLISGLQAWPVI